MPLTRWTDERLDDLARQVQANTEQIKEYAKFREALIRLEARLDGIGEDAHNCLSDLKDLKASLARREEIQHAERKADRRWMIGTAIATAGLIVAALAIFIG